MFSNNITLDEIVSVFQSLNANKAFGPDGIPPGLFKIKSCQKMIVALCLPLFQQSYASKTEPIQFKGGVIMDLLKSAGFFLDCSASRGILLRNILGKTYRKIIRQRTMPFLESVSLDTMCGGLLHRGCDFASHILNSTFDLCRMRKTCLICLFVDVVAAFDSVIHSFIVDLELSDESIIYLMNFSTFLLVLFKNSVRLSGPNVLFVLLLFQTTFMMLSPIFLPTIGF